MGRRRGGVRHETETASLARIRREALERLRRVGLKRIGALDRQITRLCRQQQALLSDLRATLESIRRAADVSGLGGSRSARGSRFAAVGVPAGQHLRLVGGLQRRVAPETVSLREVERDHIAAVLVSCRWNQSLAAVRLGIGRNTLMRKVKAFRLRKTTPRAA